MKVIHNWLADYTSKLNISPEKLSELLTARAVEVDGVTDLKDKLEAMVVGKILVLEKHPRADRLRLAQVSVGENRLSIVCGAPNIYEGMFVAVAQPGVQVIDMKTGEWVSVEPATIRGVDSQGMIVGADEIGLATGAAAHQEKHVMDLTELAQDKDVGKSIGEVLDVSPVYDLDVLANRPDLMSHRGVAIEIAGLLNLKYQEPKFSLPKPKLKKSPIPFKVEAKKLTPRYAGLVLSGVKYQLSPAWLQHRLRRAGIRPINFMVDVTNYVMLDMGLALHAFDLDQVHEYMKVRESKKGDRVKTLDGKEHVLPVGSLVIEDAQGLIDLAGIMGGASSMITDQTQRVFLQAAVFDGSIIRQTSQALGHRTEASSRFEKGISLSLVTPGLAKAFQLLKRYIPSIEVEYVVDIQQPQNQAPQIVVRTAKTNSLLGSKVTTKDIETILKALGFRLLKKTKDSLQVKAPVQRLDVKIEEDVIEEVGRYLDYNSLPSTAPEIVLAKAATKESIRLRPAIFSTLAANGWNEVMQLSFTNEKNIQESGLPVERHVRLVNPMSEDQVFLRSELLSSLLRVACQQTRQVRQRKIFEMAHVFIPQGKDCVEIPHLSGVVLGQDSFVQAKGLVEYLTSRFHIFPIIFEPASHWAFKPDACLKVKVGTETLGTVGQFTSLQIKSAGLDQPAAGFEILYDQLIHLSSPRFAYQDIPTFPSIKLDVAVVIPQSVPWAEVAAAVQAHGGPFLCNLEPFDTYIGDPIPEGKKNLAFRVEFQAPDRTLEMVEAEAARAQIVNALNQKWGANLR